LQGRTQVTAGAFGGRGGASGFGSGFDPGGTRER